VSAAGVIAVTGSTGELGGRVARLLADRGAAQRLLVRDAGRAPSLLPGAEVAQFGGYDDAAGAAAALRGARTLFMVSGREHPDRVAQHQALVDAAVAAGVERVVYTSFISAAPDTTFTFGRDHWHTEQLIRAADVEFTFLRDNFYLDFVPFFAGEDGMIRGPAGGGRGAFVARDDIADAAAVVLASEGHAGATYGMTGPEAFTLGWAAERLSEVTGREVGYVDETVAEAFASRAGSGAPEFEVEGWVSSYVAMAEGELDVVTGDVERLTGHAPVGLVDWLEAHPESWAHLRG
jgi:NAD(P)H dehydrogenase (quinone)